MIIAIKSKTNFLNRNFAQTKTRNFTVHPFPPVESHIRHEPPPPHPHKLTGYSPFRTGTAEDLEKYYTGSHRRMPHIRGRILPRIPQTTV